MIARTVEHRGHTLGSTTGWHALVRAVGERPWWLYVPASEWERKLDVLHTPSSAQTNSALAVLGALAAVLLVAAVRRRWDLCAGTLIALGLCAAMVEQVANNPGSKLLAETLGYTLWWGSELGFWVWLVLFWALWLGLSGLVRLLLARTSLGARMRGGWSGWGGGWKGAAAGLPLALAGLAGLALVGASVAREERADSHVYEYRPAAATASALERVLPPGEGVDYSFGALDLGTQPMEPAIRFLLVRHGDRVMAPGSFPRLGTYYELRGHPYRWVVYLSDGTRAAGHMRLVSRVAFRSPWGEEVFSAWVRRANAGRATGAGPSRQGGRQKGPRRRPARALLKLSTGASRVRSAPAATLFEGHVAFPRASVFGGVVLAQQDVVFAVRAADRRDRRFALVDGFGRLAAAREPFAVEDRHFVFFAGRLISSSSFSGVSPFSQATWRKMMWPSANLPTILSGC